MEELDFCHMQGAGVAPCTHKLMGHELAFVRASDGFTGWAAVCLDANLPKCWTCVRNKTTCKHVKLVVSARGDCEQGRMTQQAS